MSLTRGLSGERTSRKQKPAVHHGPHTIHVHRAKGGFVVHHDEYHPAELSEEQKSEPQQPYVLPSLSSLHDHLDQHLGPEGPSEEQPGEGE